MKNNKVLSTLLLATALLSMTAGTLAANKNVYNKANADVTYKTIYLSIPGPDLFHPGEVTKPDGTESIEWAKDNKVKMYIPARKTQYPYPGVPMNKIDQNLYTLTLTSDDINFFFTANVDGKNYRSSLESGYKHTFEEIVDNNTAFTLVHYNVDTLELSDVGSWGNPRTKIADSDFFAHAFLAVVGEGTCLDSGNTDFAKLTTVWGEMKYLYDGLTTGVQDYLRALKTNSEGFLGEFAKLYDYVYKKYGNYVGFGTNFIGRDVTADPAPASKYVTSSAFNDDTTRSVVVVASISGVSLSIVGLYFLLRKRKEDK